MAEGAVDDILLDFTQNDRILLAFNFDPHQAGACEGSDDEGGFMQVHLDHDRLHGLFADLAINYAGEDAFPPQGADLLAFDRALFCLDNDLISHFSILRAPLTQFWVTFAL